MWSLEHIPAAAPESAVTRPLAEWGISSAQLQFVNWGIDTLSLTIGGATAATAAPLFGYLDQLVVRRDGVIVFRGWITGHPVQAEAEAESLTYTAAGAGWWLQFYRFAWQMSPEEETVADAANRVAWLWALFAVQAATAAGAPITSDTTSFAALAAPVPDLRGSSNCAEVLARAARLHPLSAGWWDYSGATPLARSSLRAGLTTQSIDLGAFGSALQLTPRPDLQLKSVRIDYSYPNPTAGLPDIVDAELAGDGGGPSGPNRLAIAIAVDSLQASADARSFGIAGILWNALKDLVWEGTVTLTETDSQLPLLRPGYALRIEGGRAEWETMAPVIQSVTYTLTPEQPDVMAIALGAPEHLGPQDILEFARAGYQSGAGGAGNPSPYPPPTPPPEDLGGGVPGTYNELNDNTPTGSPGGTVAVQSRGAAWVKCGFMAFDGSAPTRRWLTKSLDGAFAISTNGAYCTCDGVVLHAGGESHSWAGANTYDPAGCTLTIGASYAYSWCGGTGMQAVNGLGDWPAGAFDTTVTATSRSVVGTGVCYRKSLCSLLCDGPAAASGSASETLAAEDTEEAAYARAIAAAPDWANGGSAIQTVPVSVATGVRRSLRYRTEHTADGVQIPTLTGLRPWSRYRLAVVLTHRPVDETGASAGAATSETIYSAAWIADLNGEGGIDWQSIDPTPGIQTTITAATVEAF